jgi:hypothetical protein
MTARPGGVELCRPEGVRDPVAGSRLARLDLLRAIELVAGQPVHLGRLSPRYCL